MGPGLPGLRAVPTLSPQYGSVDPLGDVPMFKRARNPIAPSKKLHLLQPEMIPVPLMRLLLLTAATLCTACVPAPQDRPPAGEEPRLLYAYEYHPAGDPKYDKLIKQLSRQRKLSLKETHYVYGDGRNLYIYHRYPVTEPERIKGPIVIPKAEAERMMAE